MSGTGAPPSSTATAALIDPSALTEPTGRTPAEHRACVHALTTARPVIIRDGHAPRQVTPVLAPDGTIVHLVVPAAAPPGPAQTPPGVHADITDQTVRGLNHEVRNLISAGIQVTELLLDSLHGSDSNLPVSDDLTVGQLVEDLNLVHRDSHRLREFTQLAADVNGSGRQQRAFIELDDAAETGLNDWADATGNDSAAVHVEHDPIDELVAADPDVIARIVRHLLDVATAQDSPDASTDGPTADAPVDLPRLRTGPCTPSLRRVLALEPDRWAELSLTFTSAAELCVLPPWSSRAWRPFAEPQTGTGHGCALAAVAGLAGMVGGAVWATARDQGRTTVSVALPLGD